MLSYIKSNEEMKKLGHNPNQSTIRINGNNRVWRKCFMNGDTVGFYVLARR